VFGAEDLTTPRFSSGSALYCPAGVSINPPNGSIAEKPTSSSTLGASSGAIGWAYGSQSGTDFVMSRLTTP